MACEREKGGREREGFCKILGEMVEEEEKKTDSFLIASWSCNC